MNQQADTAQRLATYQRLAARNRLVGILRIGVPLLGAITLAVLIGQIYISSLGSRFGIGRIAVTPDRISVDAPEYSGVMEDGTSYRIWATGAEAAPDATNLITLTEAALSMQRADGVRMDISAPRAVLDSTAQTVQIADVAYVEDSTGTSGVVHDSIFDYAAQKLVGHGPVTIDYADGTTLVGTGMTYDARASVWTFAQADVTVPSTPGSQTP